MMKSVRGGLIGVVTAVMMIIPITSASATAADPTATVVEASAQIPLQTAETSIRMADVRVPIPGMRQGAVFIDLDWHWGSVDVIVNISTAARGYLVKYGSNLLATAACLSAKIPRVICGVFGGVAGELVYHYMKPTLQNPCFIEYRVNIGIPKIGGAGVVRGINWKQGRCP